MMRQYKPGDEVVAGVKIIAPIGAGGFGMVYKVSVSGGVEKALKIINLQGTQGIKEFNALRLIKRISHPNLVEIDSYWLRDMQGKLINFDSDDSINAEKQALELIILMSLGRMSLLDLLNQYRKQGKPGIPYPELIELMTDAAKAIDFLNSPHDLGLKEPVCVQHGDIKPGNILLKGNSVQVCDYGLAKAITKGPRTSVALFSPAYCSPEANNNKPSNWSDQFSLAISYYELRTGKLPFNEEDAMNAGIEAVLGKLDFTLVPRLEQEVLHRATDPVPHQRFPKCIDFVNALRASQSSQRDSGSKPRTLEEILQPDSEIVSGYKLLHRLNFSERDEFWKAITPASKQFVIHVIREFKGSLGNQLVQALETLRQMDEHDNLINLRNCWTLHTDGRAVPYVDPSSLGDDTMALVTLLDNVECTLEDYYNECLKRKHPGIPEHELMQFMSQTARGVDYLTQVGYAEFLDLKPQTILLTKNKSVKIGITGLAKRLMAGATTLTTDRLVNAFAPPELFDFAVGKHWNSNQYSLALTYYWLRSRGKLPFPPHSTPKQIRDYHLQGQLDFSAVSEREQTILYNATVQDPNQRFESCDAFVEALSIAVGYSLPAGVSGRHPGSDPIMDRQTPHPGSRTTPQPGMYEEQGELAQRPTPSTLPGRTTPQNTPQGSSVEGTLDFGEIDFERLYGPGLTGPRSGGPKVMQAIVKQATPQESVPPVYPKPGDNRVSDGTRSFREEAELRRRKRKRVALITTLSGLLVVATTVGLIVAKVLWAPPSPTTIASTDPVPDPLKAKLEQAGQAVVQALDQFDFDRAKELISQQNDPAWVDEYRKQFSTKLEPWLNGKMEDAVKKDKKQMRKLLDEYSNKYQGMLTQNWINTWTKRVNAIETEMISGRWAARWNELLDKLESLNADKLTSIKQETEEVLKEATSDSDKQQAQQLLTSLKELERIHEQVQSSDANTLNKALTDYLVWEKSAHQKLLRCTYCNDISSQSTPRVRKLIDTAADAGTLKSYQPLLTNLLKIDPRSPAEWIYASQLEMALNSNQAAEPASSQLAAKLVSNSPYSKFVKARWLMNSKPDEALGILEEILPRFSTTETLKQAWRQNSIVQQLDKMLADARDQQPDTFKKDRHAEVSKVLAILQKWPSVADEKKREYLVQAKLLEMDMQPEQGKKALQDYSRTDEFKKLPDPLQKRITARLGTGQMLNAPLKERLQSLREMLDKYLAGGEPTRADMMEQIIIPFSEPKLSDPKTQQEINKLTDAERKQLAGLLSDLGEELIFEKDKWNVLIEGKGLSADTTRNLLRFTTQLVPSNHEYRLRYILSQYVKSNDALIKEWEAYASTAKREAPDYFGSYLLGGISTYMEVIHSSINADEVPIRIQQLKAADTDYQNALKKLDKNHRFYERYAFIITLDRSNIALRLANLHYTRKEQEQYLGEALTLAREAVAKDENNAEARDNLGVILEDRAMLLGMTDEYANAVIEYGNAIGQLGKSLRSKPLLHRGRCLYRWGKTLGDPTQYDKAIRDFSQFLLRQEPVLYQIEALLFRAQCYFAKSALRKEHTASWVEMNNLGFADLRKAKELIEDNSIVIWKRKQHLDTIDQAFEITEKIIIKHKRQHAAYSKDPYFEEMVKQIQSIQQSLEKDDALYSYITGRLAAVQEADPLVAKNLALENYAKAIAQLKKEKYPDPNVYYRTLDVRSKTYEATREYKNAYDDTLEAYSITNRFNFPELKQYEFLINSCKLAFTTFYNGSKDEKYWIKARDHLIDAIRDYPQLVNRQDFKLYFEQLFSIAPTLKLTQETISKLEEAVNQVEPASREKFKVLLAQVKESVPNSK